MEFTKQFAEAAQQAVLRKIEADQWENLPWLAKLVRKVASSPFTPPFDTCCDMQEIDMNGLDMGDINPVPKNEDLTPVDICGCPFGKCTCLSKKPGEPEVRVKTELNSDILNYEDTMFSQPSDFGARDSFESNDFSHVDGYDWRIMVADRGKKHSNSWAEHFSYRPSQEEFENQFRHFHARTHHVHVNQWVDGDWITITPEYVPHWNKEKPAETFTATEEWPNMKTHRIKFWDQRIGAYNYVYFDRHPGGIVLHKYHTTKCYAVVQKRPEGV